MQTVKATTKPPGPGVLKAGGCWPTEPRTSPLNLKSAWLLNIAYMTLGEYPQGVPESYRMPEAVFASGEDFPRFENVAPKLGLDTFNLSGGAVFDDLDGDELLDIFTTTFDTTVGPRFFHNEGDGTFSDRTSTSKRSTRTIFCTMSCATCVSAKVTTSFCNLTLHK